MVISEIQSLYRDEDDLFRTVIKRIYEEQIDDKWVVRKVEILYEDGEPAQPLEYRHGWIVPPAWEFISEVWAYERKPESEITYDHDSEVTLLDGNGETPILREE